MRRATVGGPSGGDIIKYQVIFQRDTPSKRCSPYFMISLCLLMVTLFPIQPSSLQYPSKMDTLYSQGSEVTKVELVTVYGRIKNYIQKCSIFFDISNNTSFPIYKDQYCLRYQRMLLDIVLNPSVRIPTATPSNPTLYLFPLVIAYRVGIVASRVSATRKGQHWME